MRPFYTVLVEDNKGNVLVNWNIEVYNGKYESMSEKKQQAIKQQQNNNLDLKKKIDNNNNSNFDKLPIQEDSYLLACFDAYSGKWSVNLVNEQPMN